MYDKFEKGVNKTFIYMPYGMDKVMYNFMKIYPMSIGFLSATMTKTTNDICITIFTIHILFFSENS